MAPKLDFGNVGKKLYSDEIDLTGVDAYIIGWDVKEGEQNVLEDFAEKWIPDPPITLDDYKDDPEGWLADMKQAFREETMELMGKELDDQLDKITLAKINTREETNADR